MPLFDTETNIRYNAAPANINTHLGNITAVEHEAKMLTKVQTGWIINDLQGRAIVDEYKMSDALTFSGRGINPVKAAASLVGRKEAVKRVSNNIGQNYATRLIPYYIRVTRDYYVKGNKNFKKGKRKARTGNWDGAAEIWLKETKNSKDKLAGRACLNMAIIEEMNGNLEKALEWAQKSYEDYNIKIARDYTKILNNRLAKQKRVDWQMKR